MIIAKVSERYNKKHAREFKRKGATEKFLGPIGLYDKPITAVFSKDSSPIPDEQAYFRAFHFVKFRLHKAHQEASKRVDFWYRMFTLLRNRLVSGNMGLVYECIRKSSCAAAFRDKTEFISAGSMTLIRAVECFDPWKGHRFSTYACRAILYRYSHVAHLLNHPPAMDITEADAPDESLVVDEHMGFLVDRMLVAIQHSGLTKQERDVLRMRFNDGLKLVEIGDHYNVTKERARQIQEIALTKIRATMKSDSNLGSHNLVALNCE